MIAIKKLKRPVKKSGYKLAPGATTEVRGMTIVNRNAFPVYIDKFTAPRVKRLKRKAKAGRK